MMQKINWSLLAVLSSMSLLPLCFAQKTCSDVKTGSQPVKINGAIVFQTEGLAVDADGAPNSYLVDGKGLSETCDGVVAVVNGKRVSKKTDPNHWYAICKKAWADAQTTHNYKGVAIFGFLADKNGPVVQKQGDPLPDKAYITTNTLTVPGTTQNTQRHWADATAIPFVVLSPDFEKTYHAHSGDLAIVYRPGTTKVAFGVFGDSGDLGEASVKLHRDLGNEPIITRNGISRAKSGIEDRVITLVFPEVAVARSNDANAWNLAIQQTGKAALDKWGGMDKLKTCAKETSPKK